MTRIAFIGLGAMGFPMAGHLAKNGHSVTVYNRTTAKAEKWAQSFSGKTAKTPAEAAGNAEIIFTCVGNDNDLRSVVSDESGIFNGMKKGAVLIDHTTTSATIAKELYSEAKSKGFSFLDAPVSGGQSGAEKGILTIMVGGDEETYIRAEPIMKSYAKAITHIGGPGAGQLTKMVNQICSAGIVQSLAEALSFGQNSGLDMDKVLSAISSGAATSWWMLNRSEKMLKGEFEEGFAVDWYRKDLGICLDESRHNKTSLPVTALVDQFYSDLQKQGNGRLDSSSLIKRLK